MSLETEGRARPFAVSLANFEGPFDLLLSLIAKHQLDITEIALSEVTDEFVAYIQGQGADWDLDQASNFLVVAATLLDLKVARLLPQGEVDNAEDLELLEARDLLFARLLQYRAFKQLAGWLEDRLAQQSRQLPHPGGVEEQFIGLLPSVQLNLTVDQLAGLAIQAMTPKAAAEVFVEHIHLATVSVAEQAALLAGRLQEHHQLSFRALIADADSTLLVVARFLAVLELYRSDQVVLEQLEPLTGLTIRWVGQDGAALEITDDYDQSRPDRRQTGSDQTEED
ncbi:MAG: segregation/condensation protein A [Propionibacteriaceae bacterium]|jgi:segregation and condensation protein A|nr:segregation/condensation protein A [Propionibacteriaceae bacterium]